MWKRAGSCVPKASGSITFNYTGSQQTWTVPEYVASIKIIIFLFFNHLIVIKSETGVKIVIN